MKQDPVVLLVTRPAVQAAEFAEAAARRLGAGLCIELSPIIEIVPVEAALDLAGLSGLIFTSVHGVRRFTALSDRRDIPTHCVGPRVAALARDSGFAVAQTAANAGALVQMLGALPPEGKLLHLRGAHTRLDLAEALGAAGWRCDDAVVYDQVPRPLTASARAVLRGRAPVIVPLFSPRSAALLGAESRDATAPLLLAAISNAALGAWAGPTPARVEIAATPDREGMLAALEALFDAGHRLVAGPRAR